MGKEQAGNRSPFRSLIQGLGCLSAALWVLSSATSSFAQNQVRLARADNGKAAETSQPKYVDRVIEGLATESEPDDEAAATQDREGWPRFLRMETRLGTNPYTPNTTSTGVTLAGAVDTPNHGTLSFDLQLLLDDGSNSFTLRQRGLPVDGGWEINNEAGVTTPLAPALMRAPSRVFVPWVATIGATTEWLNRDAGTQWLASIGDVGTTEGYPVSGFHKTTGRLTTLGGQQNIGSWALAGRYARADDVRSIVSNGNTSGDSAQFALRHATQTSSTQGNVVASTIARSGETRTGAWIDSEWRVGSSRYGAGAYRLDRDLDWAGQAMPADIEGIYGKGVWQALRWSADANVDVMRDLSGAHDTGILLSGSGRWLQTRTLNFGAGASLRDYNGRSGTVYADTHWQNDWGQSSLRAEASDYRYERTSRATLDHAWLLSAGWVLNTSLTGGWNKYFDRSGSLWGAAASFVAPIGQSLRLQGSATTEKRDAGGDQSTANLTLLWQLAPRWAVEGNVTYSQGRPDLPHRIDPLAPLPILPTLPYNQTTAYVVLRYFAQAGSSSVPLGGLRGGGGGSIQGVVFFDTNRDGVQQANELGAPGVTIYLEGRYAVRTDSQGRFEFPFVSPGPRTLTVLNETLPLPWEIGDKADVKVDVVVRDTARIAIPVVRRGTE
jgi:hypothetical protein